MISASTSSATLRVLENGALNTGMPRSSAAARSTWLVPMQKQPTPVSRDVFSKNSRSELRGRAYADKVSVRRGARQFFAAQRLLVILDVAVAVRLEFLRGAGMNAFQQQDLDLTLIQ